MKLDFEKKRERWDSKKGCVEEKQLQESDVRSEIET